MIEPVIDSVGVGGPSGGSVSGNDYRVLGL